MSMQAELCGKRLVTYFVEWCNMPCNAAPGFSCSDSSWVFDNAGKLLVPIQPNAGTNIYLYLPCPPSGILSRQTHGSALWGP